VFDVTKQHNAELQLFLELGYIGLTWLLPLGRGAVGQVAGGRIVATRKSNVQKSRDRKRCEDSFDPVLSMQRPQEESTENSNKLTNQMKQFHKIIT
jgi:hypothetical protein